MDTWQIGIVRGEITHIAVAQVGHERHHNRAVARAALEVRQLLVDRARILPGKVRRICLAQAACAVAHGATQCQCRATTNQLRTGVTQHAGDDFDLCDRITGLHDGLTGWSSVDQAGRRADRIPQAAELLAGLLERQPRETCNDGDDRDTSGDSDAGDDPTIAQQRTASSSSLWCSNAYDRHFGAWCREKMCDRKAVVNDSKADHQS